MIQRVRSACLPNRIKRRDESKHDWQCNDRQQFRACRHDAHHRHRFPHLRQPDLHNERIDPGKRIPEAGGISQRDGGKREGARSGDRERAREARAHVRHANCKRRQCSRAGKAADQVRGRKCVAAAEQIVRWRDGRGEAKRQPDRKTGG